MGIESLKLRTNTLIKGGVPKEAPFAPLSPRAKTLNPLAEKMEPMVPLDPAEAASAHSGRANSTELAEIITSLPQGENLRDTAKQAKEKEMMLIRVAQLYQLYGSPAHHIEDSTRAAAEGLGMQLDIKSFPGFLIATFASQDTSETIFQTTVSGYHLKKLERIDTFARRCAAGQFSGSSLEEGISELDTIMMAPDPWSIPVLLLMYGISHGLSALCLFNGGWRDAVLSAGLGVLTGLSTLKLERIISPKLVKLNGFFSCVINSFIVRIVQLHVHPSISFFPSVVSSILGILPGLGITLGAIEISQSQIVAGTARMVYSLFKTLLIAIGISMGSQIAFHVSRKEAADIVSINPYTLSRWQSVAAFPLLLFSLSITSNSSSNQFASQIMTGLCGLIVYTECVVLKFSKEMTVTLAAIVVASVGHLFMMYNRRPSLIPTLSGLSMLVPGGLSVRGAAGSIVGGEEFGESGSILISVLTVAISIALGVFIANVMMHPGRHPKLERLGR
ncbi:membrane protein [Perkinsela sp. CCAP 1560/4]|nr:membrane protein [Perkinsela sp. CCAP 1560/4]|eukprot:KNH03888.1 membrane protein [Perkinsela sp. CCAP 1560/4]